MPVAANPKRASNQIDVGADIVAIYAHAAKLRGESWPPPSEPFVPLRPQPAIATIYFIGPEDGPIKIGWASRLKFRLRDLELANAFPLVVWATVEGPVKLEREYHKQFKAHRLHGEWFARHPDILAEIARLTPTPETPHAA
jgi:hypothetical protein